MGGPGAGRRFGHLTLAPAAALAGAAGLALEVLLIESSGLALGYGRSGALGLATFLSGWALGAWAGGRVAADARRALLGAGALALVAAGLAESAVLAVAGRAPGGSVAGWGALAAIGAVALVQGAFLPLLLRASVMPDEPADLRRGVGWLFAANLAGAVLGAPLGHLAARHVGRVPAAWAFGLVALAAGAWGAAFARSGAVAHVSERASERANARPGLRAAGVAVGLGTAWLVTLEWVGLRLGTLWIGGMQASLTALLAATMLALAAGAALVPALLPRGRGALGAWLVLAGLLSLWPLAAGPLAGAAGIDGDVPDVLRALFLIGPALAPFGALVPVAYRAAGAGPGELGSLLVNEAWGALLGVPLAHAFVVPRLGLTGALAFGLGLGALLALSSVPAGRSARLAFAGGLAALAAWTLSRPQPALASPPLASPALTVLAFEEDEHFAASVVDDGLLGERTLLTDGFRAAGTGEDYLYMRALGALPLLLHPEPRAVCVLALGTGTTLGAVALHPEVERVEVLELSRAVLDASPWFAEVHRGALDDPRVSVTLGDGRRTLAARREAYDVLTLEPLLPDSPFAVYLYTEDFYAAARRALRPGGLVCQWVPPHALEPATFRAVLDAFRRSFPWSGVWVFGTQAILVGAESEPALDAARFPSRNDTADAELADELRGLGLGEPEGVAGRFVTRGERLPAAPRRLTDADPWIVYRPRRAGAALLADLPENLAFLREHEEDPPAAWLAPGDGARDGDTAVRALRALRAAREEHAREEAELRGARVPEAAGVRRRPLDELLAAAASWRPAEPGLVRFERELAFLADLRRGVALLASSPAPDAAGVALPHLVAAAERRPERADVHLYLGIALERVGSDAATSALDAARERCPRIVATTPGMRARDLGLSPAGWNRLGGR